MESWITTFSEMNDWIVGSVWAKLGSAVYPFPLHKPPVAFCKVQGTAGIMEELLPGLSNMLKLLDHGGVGEGFCTCESHSQ